jgi:hypothetical protein
MKKFARLGTALFLLFLAGCDLLTWPFSLIEELLPIAIKYAPYALMFLEAPEVAPATQVAGETPLGNNEGKVDPTTAMPYVLTQQIHQGKTWCVLAFSIESQQEFARWQACVAQARQHFQLRCFVAHCDMSTSFDRQQIQAFLVKHPEVTFYINGPLRQLTTMPAGGGTKQELQRLVETMDSGNHKASK